MAPCRTVEGVEARARGGARCMRRVRAHRDFEEIESAARGLDDIECGVDEARVEQVPLQPNHSRTFDGAMAGFVKGRRARNLAALMAGFVKGRRGGRRGARPRDCVLGFLVALIW